MAKNDNSQARRFLGSMTRHGEQEAAERFAEEHPLSASANPNKKLEWAKCLCGFLDESYDDEKVKAIRMDCACGPGKGQVSKLKSVYEKDTDPHAFVENINALDLGFSLEYDGEAYSLIYPQCYCACVNKNPDILPKSWCYCTLGYSKRMFEGILGREVQAELINSVKTGADNCRIRIRVIN